MKLNELVVAQPADQTAKVFESYFGGRLNFQKITPKKARVMLEQMRGVIREHRRTPAFHKSENDPAYLKMVMLEQALSAWVAEQMAVEPMQADPQKQAALQTAQIQQKKRQEQDELKQIDQQMRDLTQRRQMLQKSISNPVMEASEVTQAQVVLASQDMVDQVQKMIETVTAMQYKDLPALVDQIKNEVGVEQSAQFNTDAQAALGGLVQNLQGSKQQLEAASGVVTGQAPVVPGEPAAAVPPEGGEDLDLDLDIDATVPVEEPQEPEEPEALPAKAVLGRGRR